MGQAVRRAAGQAEGRSERMSDVLSDKFTAGERTVWDADGNPVNVVIEDDEDDL